MIYNTPEVPDNATLSFSDISRMYHEQAEANAKQMKDLENKKKNEAIRTQQEMVSAREQYIAMHENSIYNRNKFLESVKEGFLTGALMRIMKESACFPITSADESFIKSLTTTFVREQGVGSLMSRFKNQNIYLGEIARVVQEAYDRVVDSLNEATGTESASTADNPPSVLSNSDNNVNIGDDGKPEEPKSTLFADKELLKVDRAIIDDYYKDIVNVDTTTATDMIKSKVSDAMDEFVERNMQNRVDYTDIINSAKEKMDTVASDASKEAIKAEAARYISEQRLSRPKNVFHYLVESITKSAFKDPNLRLAYLEDGAHPNMDKIVHSAGIIYTMLEMVNTLQMADKSYIEQYIESIAKV